MKPRTRECPMCKVRTAGRYCCGIDLTVRRRPWRMTGERIKLVHVLARSRKGLDDETYRLRLRAVGAESSKHLSRTQFHRFVGALASLPDVPGWGHRRRSPALSRRKGVRA